MVLSYPFRRASTIGPRVTPKRGDLASCRDPDAAVPRRGFEPSGEADRRTHALEQAAEEVEVHPAHKLAVLLGETVEGTVRERDLVAAPELGFIAVPCEHLDDGVATFACP